MSSLPWFRFYSRFITDPDVEELSFEDQRHYVFLLCMKNDGLLDKDFQDQAKRDRAIGRRLGLQGEALTFAKERLVESGLIDTEWQPRNWYELQMRSDSSTERVRKHREKKRNEVKRYSNGAEEIREEQIRTEQNREAPEGLNHKAWDDYVQHRKDLRVKKLTERGARASMEKLAKLTPEEQQAAVDLSIANGWAGLFPEKSPSAKPTYAEQLAAEMTAKGLR